MVLFKHTISISDKQNDKKNKEENKMKAEMSD